MHAQALRAHWLPAPHPCKCQKALIVPAGGKFQVLFVCFNKDMKKKAGSVFKGQNCRIALVQCVCLCVCFPLVTWFSCGDLKVWICKLHLEKKKYEDDMSGFEWLMILISISSKLPLVHLWGKIKPLPLNLLWITVMKSSFRALFSYLLAQICCFFCGVYCVWVIKAAIYVWIICGRKPLHWCRI